MENKKERESFQISTKPSSTPPEKGSCNLYHSVGDRVRDRYDIPLLLEGKN